MILKALLFSAHFFSVFTCRKNDRASYTDENHINLTFAWYNKFFLHVDFITSKSINSSDSILADIIHDTNSIKCIIRFYFMDYAIHNRLFLRNQLGLRLLLLLILRRIDILGIIWDDSWLWIDKHWLLIHNRISRKLGIISNLLLLLLCLIIKSLNMISSRHRIRGSHYNRLRGLTHFVLFLLSVVILIKHLWKFLPFTNCCLSLRWDRYRLWR